MVDDEEIRHLNREYLNRNRPTNVLAFPMQVVEGNVHPYLLGDVVISTQTAEREAKEKGLSIREEVAILLAHGILHLLGYDHEADTEQAARMRAKEKEILAELGFKGF